MPSHPNSPPSAADNIEWRVATALVAYPEALAEMENRVAGIDAGTAPELFWLLEHPPLYTAGTSAADEELRDARGFSGLRNRTRRALHLSRAPASA